MRHAPEALPLYADSLEQEGRAPPCPRTLTELKNDPDVVGDIDGNIVALIEFRAPAHATE
jgi:hypothetical protein